MRLRAVLPCYARARHGRCDNISKTMVGYRFLRSAAIALVTYGVLGLAIAAAMLIVGFATFTQVATLQRTLENERLALVRSIRTVSGTLHDTSATTSDFQKSIDQARGAADSA